MTYLIARTMPTTTNEQKRANVRKEMTTHANDLLQEYARRKLGNDFNTVSFMGRALELFSTDAKAGRYNRLIEKGNFHQLFEMYEEAEQLIGEPFMTILAPNALSYDDFVQECSKATSYATISPSCPACGNQSLEFCTDFTADVFQDGSLEVACECLTCGLTPQLDIQIVEAVSQDESLTRSYIRSLLAYEGYDKDHGLGPIHDTRTLVRVADQTAKALVHLPDGLSIDYQTLTLDEMTK